MSNDTTTTLNPGSAGDVMDESLVTQEDGTEAKRPRVVLGDDDGALYNQTNPVPVHDRTVRAMAEREQLARQFSGPPMQARHRERMNWGDELDLFDHRGPGGR